MSVLMLIILVLAGINLCESSSCNIGIPGCRCPDSPRVAYCHDIGFTRVPRIPFTLDTLSLRGNYIDSLYDHDLAGLRVNTLILSHQNTASCVINRLTLDTNINILGLCDKVRYFFLYKTACLVIDGRIFLRRFLIFKNIRIDSVYFKQKTVHNIIYEIYVLILLLKKYIYLYI